MELLTSLPLIIHLTAFFISMEGGTEAALYSLQSLSQVSLVSCLENGLGYRGPLRVPVPAPKHVISRPSPGQQEGAGRVGWELGAVRPRQA